MPLYNKNGERMSPEFEALYWERRAHQLTKKTVFIVSNGKSYDLHRLYFVIAESQVQVETWLREATEQYDADCKLADPEAKVIGVVQYDHWTWYNDYVKPVTFEEWTKTALEDNYL